MAAYTCKWIGVEGGTAILVLVVVKQTKYESCWGGGWQHANVGGVARMVVGLSWC